MIDFPTTITPAWLVSIPGVMLLVWIILSVARQAVTAPWFNQWAPTIAVVLGAVLGGFFAIIFPSPEDGVTPGTVVLGAVAGLIGGYLSQNLNNQIQRARGNVPPPNG